MAHKVHVYALFEVDLTTTAHSILMAKVKPPEQGGYIVPLDTKEYPFLIPNLTKEGAMGFPLMLKVLKVDDEDEQVA